MQASILCSHTGLYALPERSLCRRSWSRPRSASAARPLGDAGVRQTRVFSGYATSKAAASGSDSPTRTGGAQRPPSRGDGYARSASVGPARGSPDRSSPSVGAGRSTGRESGKRALSSGSRGHVRSQSAGPRRASGAYAQGSTGGSRGVGAPGGLADGQPQGRARAASTGSRGGGSGVARQAR